MRINRGSTFMERQVMIEPLDDSTAKQGLVMAPVLVKTREGDLVKVRLLNPWHTPQKLRVNTAMARAVPVETEVLTLVNEEDSTER